MTPERGWSLVVLCAPLAVAVAGACRGTPTPDEIHARTDIDAAASVYRPKGARPPLPALTATSPLAQLVEYAALQSPRAEAAFYEWKAAVEEITTARSLPDPMLSFSAEVMNGLAAFTPMLMTDPAMSWPGPGKRELRADAAYQAALMKRAAFENEMLGAALAVKRAYVQLWVVQEQVRWTRDALIVVDEAEKLARERLAVGQAGQQDVLRAQMERDRMKAQLASLEDSRAPVAARLRSALGLAPDHAVPDFVATLVATTPDLSERSLLEVGFARNPKLKEMRSEVVQAVALYQLAQKGRVPDFSFGLGANLRSSPAALMPTVGLTLPVWRDRIAAEVARGAAGVSAARARLSAEELELAVRFAEASFAWREADRNVKLYGERLLPKAKAALAAARAGYTAGATGFLDLLEAERTLLECSLGYAMATGERELALAEVSLVILGRWPEGARGVLGAEPARKLNAQGAP